MTTERFSALKVLALEEIIKMGRSARIAALALSELGFDRKNGTVMQLETVVTWAEAERQKLREIHG